MAFLYSKLFPEFFDCVQETTSNPTDIRSFGAQIYPVGMPLEKAMALIWKSKQFNLSGTANYPYECCSGNVPAYSIWTFSGQTTSTNPSKMSELACSFSANYLATSLREDYNCDGNIETSVTEEEQFGFGAFDNRIFLYNQLYFIPIYYFFAGGSNFSEDIGHTYYNGSVTIDGVILPLYSQEPFCPPISANIVITTSLEREAN
jgi:hypothetical protein